MKTLKEDSTPGVGKISLDTDTPIVSETRKYFEKRKDSELVEFVQEAEIIKLAIRTTFSINEENPSELYKREEAKQLAYDVKRDYEEKMMNLFFIPSMSIQGVKVNQDSIEFEIYFIFPWKQNIQQVEKEVVKESVKRRTFKENYRDTDENLKIIYNMIKHGGRQAKVIKELFTDIQQEYNITLGGGIEVDSEVIDNTDELSSRIDDEVEDFLDDGMGRIKTSPSPLIRETTGSVEISESINKFKGKLPFTVCFGRSIEGMNEMMSMEAVNDIVEKLETSEFQSDIDYEVFETPGDDSANSVEIKTEALLQAIMPFIKQDDPKSTGFSLSFLTRMIYSCLVDADWLNTEKFDEENKGSESAKRKESNQDLGQSMHSSA